MTRPICAAGGPDCEGPIDAGNLCRAHRADYGDTQYGQPLQRSIGITGPDGKRVDIQDYFERDVQ